MEVLGTRVFLCMSRAGWRRARRLARPGCSGLRELRTRGVRESVVRGSSRPSGARVSDSCRSDRLIFPSLKFCELSDSPHLKCVDQVLAIFFVLSFCVFFQMLRAFAKSVDLFQELQISSERCSFGSSFEQDQEVIDPKTATSAISAIFSNNFLYARPCYPS